MANHFRLKLPGRSVSPSQDSSKSHEDLKDFLTVHVKHAVEVGLSVRGTAAETVLVEDTEDGDLIELQYEGGLYRWIRADQLVEDLRERGIPVTRGKQGEAEFTLPADFGMPASRGLGDVLLKAVRVLKPALVDLAADAAVRGVIGKFEDRQQPSPGLYFLDTPAQPRELVSEVTFFWA